MDDLTKYVKEKLKAKTKLSVLVFELKNSGYSKRQIYTSLFFAVWKMLLVIFLSVIFLFIATIFLIGVFTELSIDESIVTFDDSKNLIFFENSTIVNIPEITNGLSAFSGVVQEYYIPKQKILTTFALMGIYNGKQFEEYAYEENNLVMQINQKLNPHDGVINGFIVEKINDFETNNVTAYIYVDSEWRKAMPDTKIFWGSDYQYYTEYEFNEISDGIYMMEIYDDPNRHMMNMSISFGGIIVGNLNENDIITGNLEGKTVMRLYS